MSKLTIFPQDTAFDGGRIDTECLCYFDRKTDSYKPRKFVVDLKMKFFSLHKTGDTDNVRRMHIVFGNKKYSLCGFDVKEERSWRSSPIISNSPSYGYRLGGEIMGTMCLRCSKELVNKRLVK